MWGASHRQQAVPHPARCELASEALRPRKRSHLVRCAVQQKRWGAVLASAQARQGTDGGDERWRWRGEGGLDKRASPRLVITFLVLVCWVSVAGGRASARRQAVEQQWEADAFLEESQDEFRPGIAGSDPSEIGGIAFGRVVVVRDLRYGLIAE